MLSFDEARAIVAASQGWDPAPWGWENDEVFVMAYDHGGEPVSSGEPELIVDKCTGELRWVWAVSGEAVAPDLRWVGVSDEH